MSATSPGVCLVFVWGLSSFCLVLGFDFFGCLVFVWGLSSFCLVLGFHFWGGSGVVVLGRGAVCFWRLGLFWLLVPRLQLGKQD